MKLACVHDFSVELFFETAHGSIYFYIKVLNIFYKNVIVNS